MLRIGQVESSATVDGKYTDGSVAGGIAATRLRAAAFNAIQEELANIVESAGMTLDPDDVTQVLAALKKQFISRVNPFADIKADVAVAVATALSNLGLGETVRDEFVSCFSATSTAQSVTASSNTAMLCKTVNFDDTGEYNATAGRFVAENGGTYIFTGSVHGVGSTVSWRTLMIYVNGAERFRLQENTSMRCDCAIVGSSTPIKLNAGDYVQLYYSSSVADSLNGIVFGGVRIK